LPILTLALFFKQGYRHKATKAQRSKATEENILKRATRQTKLS
jgi:hypothetical protein